MSEYNYNEKYFEVIDEEHKAYWLGFLYADGYVEPIYRKNKIKAFRIEIGLEINDKSHLIRFREDINSNSPITERTQKIKSKEYKSCRLRINNTKMCRDLIQLGCTTCKSLTLEFPNNKILPNNLIRHFIRGYFDGDGCIHYSERQYIDKRNNKEYTQKSTIASIVGTTSFLGSVSNILSKCSVNFKNVNNSNCGKADEIRLCKHEELYNFYKYLYEDATVFLLRKKEKFDYIFKKFNIKIPASLI